MTSSSDIEAQHLLEVEDLTCRFGDVVALQDVSIGAREGEFVSIVGPSGCGKSTLMNVISGLDRPTSGRVLLRGQDITGQTGHVSYMFQKDLLIPWRTVLGNITLGASLRRRPRREDIDWAADMAMRYGLGAFIDNYPHTLSGGMRQRVALMRTLALHRPIMLLDEPFGALDSQTRAQLQEWLLTVWSDTGGTIFFITHDIDEAVFLSDRVLVMSSRPGRVAAEFTVDLPRPRHLDITTTERFISLKRMAMDVLYDRHPSGADVEVAR